MATGASGSEVADEVEDVGEDVGDDCGERVEAEVEAEVEADIEVDVGDGVVEEGVGREEASEALDTTELIPDDCVKLSVVDAVVATLEAGDDVSHAVSGPNSLIR